jgi:hypothetical protein
MNQFLKLRKAIGELGLTKLWYYSLYWIGLRSGLYQRVNSTRQASDVTTPGLPPYPSFPRVTQAQRDLTLAEADEVRRGFVRLFGGDPVPLDLEAGASTEHWTALTRTPPARDIKFVWEPGRFGWAITLARAYAFSGDPVYAQAFWEKTFIFIKAHPPNLGRQWQSAQEVAIRLMVLVFCDRVLATAPSSSLENRKRLWQAVAEYARRIPPTIIYARAQNNNHLLSEAAGLYTAGIYLSDHPQAEKWRQVGWRWLNWGFQNQINEFGSYVQHSVNYHRLMLQLALFVNHMRQAAGDPDWPLETRARLSAAARWLWAVTDPKTGAAPNLGANDGAYIFPFTALAHDDFRPVVDAAAKAFLNQDVYDQPDLAEMADWFNLTAPVVAEEKQPHAADLLRVETENGRAFIHTACFSDRPSHADQLHVDLWWRGINVALDPGTYQYNASPPWDNALATTRVHNTLTLNAHDQMMRAGPFLWLDWAQAAVLLHEIDEQGRLFRIRADHDGYRKFGVRHQRTLMAFDAGWTIKDEILDTGKHGERAIDVCLTWLMPDWDWMVAAGDLLCLTGPGVDIQLQIEGIDQLNLYRAGKLIHGTLGPEATWGWSSKTYGVKKPALMVVATQIAQPPMVLTSQWRFDT